jgi:hypothetical protein
LFTNPILLLLLDGEFVLYLAVYSGSSYELVRAVISFSQDIRRLLTWLRAKVRFWFGVEFGIPIRQTMAVKISEDIPPKR